MGYGYDAAVHRTYVASDIFAQIDLSPVIYLLGFALAYNEVYLHKSSTCIEV